MVNKQTKAGELYGTPVSFSSTPYDQLQEKQRETREQKAIAAYQKICAIEDTLQMRTYRKRKLYPKKLTKKDTSSPRGIPFLLLIQLLICSFLFFYQILVKIYGFPWLNLWH